MRPVHLLCALTLLGLLPAHSLGAQSAAAPAPVNFFTRAAGASVHSFSSEFGAGWVADNLVPGPDQLSADGVPLTDIVWSSASSAPFPHWVIVALPERRWITTLVFNNALSDEADHPGISARLVEVHVGDTPTALRRVASFTLEKNRSGQAVQLAPVEAQFVKLVVRSNWGHPWYTELGASMAFDDGTRPSTVASALERDGRVDLYGIYFDFGSAVVRPESGEVLDAIAAFHRTHAAATLRVEGHTDDVGGQAVNGPLSQRRAEAVVAELVRRGVPAARLTALGRGASEPVASNATAAGRARNRRVAIIVK